MKCKQCGYEGEQDFTYCPSCGASSQPVSAAAKLLPVLKDPLFLVLCILMSVSCLFGILASSFDVINILITIFLWMAYAVARKDENPAKHLRCVSGSVFAMYVLYYVIAGLLVLVGGILALVFDAIIADPAFLEAVTQLSAENEDVEFLLGSLSTLSGSILLIIFVIAGILYALINFFCIRYFHRFAKSVYKSLESGKLELKYVNASRIWLIVMAVFNGISMLGAMATPHLGATSANFAITVICILLINKYLRTEK